MKTCSIDYFEETVCKFPDKLALVYGEQRISFSQLRNACRSLAITILNENPSLKPHSPIGVFIGKSANAIIGDLGVSYTGNPYVNLDVTIPAERIAAIIRKIMPECIITEEKTRSKLEESIKLAEADIKVIIIDTEMEHVLTEEEDKLLADIQSVQIDVDPCCIITTSGSTGTPKGIVMPHKNLVDYTKWAVDTFGFDENTIDGNLSATVFDHFVYETWLMIYTGATLVLLDSGMMLFPIKLLEVLQKENVNYIFWVPSMMVNVANMDLLSKIDLPHLKMIWFAGEVFPTKQFNYWRAHFPEATFVNLYGPAEITIDCTYYVADRELSDDEPIPIGKPCRNADVMVLDDDMNLCGEGQTGEIYVRCTGVTHGYYNDPEKTANAFVQNPLHNHYPEIVYKTGDLGLINEYGEIVFKGRKDSLIKHMGIRIELSEIEHAVISRLKLAEYCCVVYNHDKKEITLFYESDHDISPAEFRKELIKLLPKYMIPVKYIRKDVLPKNTNGKIDRNALNQEVNNG